MGIGPGTMRNTGVTDEWPVMSGEGGRIRPLDDGTPVIHMPAVLRAETAARFERCCVGHVDGRLPQYTCTLSFDHPLPLNSWWGRGNFLS